MQTIFRLALKNLKEHKSKTLIIALFFVFGIAIVVLGNSFLESVNRGLEKDFRENYTGDIVFSAVPEKGTTIDIFEVNTTNIDGTISQIPALPELDKVQKIVESKDEVKSFTKQISAQVLIAKDEEIDMASLLEKDDLGIMDLPVAMLFAGENPSYWETFSKIRITEGQIPSSLNEVLLEQRAKRNYEKTYGEELKIGSKILFMGMNSKGIIRECVVSGFFVPPDENTAMFQIAYSTPEFARSFADLTYASAFKEEIPGELDFSISSMDEDDLFGDAFDEDFSFADSGFDSLSFSEESLNQEKDWNNILGDTSLRDALNRTDDGAWNFILLKLKNPSSVKRMIQEFQDDLKEQGIENVQVMNWKQAAFSYSMTVEGIGIIFNILIIILAVVVFIIIMNTMTVSVIERTGEIGTMRAIGAEKKFIRRLFFAESVVLTFFSSLAGIALAFIIIAVFNSLNITLTNEIAKMILGGGLLHFSPTLSIIISVLVIAVLGSIISNLYPVSSALKITPLKALSKGSD